MIFRILKKDMIRKKTVNIILVLFVVLSAMFVASGLSNVLTVFNGTDYYCEKAGVGDYVIIRMGNGEVGDIDQALQGKPYVKECRTETVIFGSTNCLYKEDGTQIKLKGTSILQPIEHAKLNFFNKNDEKITEVPEGYVYLTGQLMKDNDLKEEDFIWVKFDGVEKKMRIKGRAKDAFLGSNFMGNKRLLFNEKDYQEFLEKGKNSSSFLGEIAYVDTEDVEKVNEAVSTIAGIAFNKPSSVIKICYVMDLIVAFITLVLSICLMIVSFLALKFSISLTITEEFREIGVMKAIGIGNKSIRGLYVLKYLALSVIGGIIGFFVSIPFGNLLLKSVTENMMLGNDLGIWVNIIGSAVVIVLIPLYAYHCTKRVKKASPIDAIRSGQTGERYNKKGALRIGKSRLSSNLFLAVNDVLSAPKRYLTILISFSICTLLMLLIANTVNTMKSDRLIDSFASRADLYLSDVDKMMGSAIRSRAEQEEELKKIEEELAKNGMPARVTQGAFYTYKVSFEGKDYSIVCNQEFCGKITDFKYDKDTVIPQNKNEILITPKITEMTGAKVGDTLRIDFGEEKLDCVVTGYFNTMQQLGTVIRLHEDAPTDTKYISSFMQYQVSFTDNPTKEEILQRKEKIIEMYGSDEVQTVEEFCEINVGVVDTLLAVEVLLLAITLIVVLLVTILMERSFIADEKTQIAILKAVGFKHKDIIFWHTGRFGFVALLAVILAAVVSVPMTKLCISPVFGMMGDSNINFKIDVLQVFVIFPAIVFAATLLSTFAVAQYTRKITCRDTASIE